MNKLIYALTVVVIQHLTLNVQNSFAQTPNDNIGSGNCLQFDGINDYVEVGTVTDYTYLHTGNPVWSVEVWYKLPAGAIDNDLKTILGTSNGDSGFSGMFLYFENRSGVANRALGLVITRSVGSSYAINGRTIDNIIPDDTEWHHIAVTYDHNLGVDNAKFYIDGVFAATLTKSGNPTSSANSMFPLSFGTNNYNNYQPLNGDLDEIRLWDRVLTQSEIRNKMCQPLAGNESGLVGYWNMNDGTGNTVSDLTTNANHGTRH